MIISVCKSIQARLLYKGHILECNWDKVFKIFPPCYSQSPHPWSKSGLNLVCNVNITGSSLSVPIPRTSINVVLCCDRSGVQQLQPLQQFQWNYQGSPIKIISRDCLMRVANWLEGDVEIEKNKPTFPFHYEGRCFTLHSFKVAHPV